MVNASPAIRVRAGTFICSISQGTYSGSPIAPAAPIAMRDPPFRLENHACQALAAAGSIRRIAVCNALVEKGPGDSAIVRRTASESRLGESRVTDHAVAKRAF